VRSGIAQEEEIVDDEQQDDGGGTPPAVDFSGGITLPPLAALFGQAVGPGGD
jgi:hypothetical protein